MVGNSVRTLFGSLLSKVGGKKKEKQRPGDLSHAGQDNLNVGQEEERRSWTSHAVSQSTPSEQQQQRQLQQSTSQSFRSASMASHTGVHGGGDAVLVSPQETLEVLQSSQALPPGISRNSERSQRQSSANAETVSGHLSALLFTRPTPLQLSAAMGSSAGPSTSQLATQGVTTPPQHGPRASQHQLHQRTSSGQAVQTLEPSAASLGASRQGGSGAGSYTAPQVPSAGEAEAAVVRRQHRPQQQQQADEAPGPSGPSGSAFAAALLQDRRPSASSGSRDGQPARAVGLPHSPSRAERDAGSRASTSTPASPRVQQVRSLSQSQRHQQLQQPSKPPSSPRRMQARNEPDVVDRGGGGVGQLGQQQAQVDDGPGAALPAAAAVGTTGAGIASVLGRQQPGDGSSVDIGGAGGSFYTAVSGLPGLSTVAEVPSHSAATQQGDMSGDSGSARAAPGRQQQQQQQQQQPPQQQQQQLQPPLQPSNKLTEAALGTHTLAEDGRSSRTNKKMFVKQWLQGAEAADGGEEVMTEPPVALAVAGGSVAAASGAGAGLGGGRSSGTAAAVAASATTAASGPVLQGLGSAQQLHAQASQPHQPAAPALHEHLHRVLIGGEPQSPTMSHGTPRHPGSSGTSHGLHALGPQQVVGLSPLGSTQQQAQQQQQQQQIQDQAGASAGASAGMSAGRSAGGVLSGGGYQEGGRGYGSAQPQQGAAGGMVGASGPAGSTVYGRHSNQQQPGLLATAGSSKASFKYVQTPDSSMASMPGHTNELILPSSIHSPTQLALHMASLQHQQQYHHGGGGVAQHYGLGSRASGQLSTGQRGSSTGIAGIALGGPLVGDPAAMRVSPAPSIATSRVASGGFMGPSDARASTVNSGASYAPMQPIPARALVANVPVDAPTAGLHTGLNNRLDVSSATLRLPNAQAARTKTIAVASHCPEDIYAQEWSIEDFTLLKKLYEGNLSVVCQAQHKRSGRHVALKIYKRSRLHEMERFQLAREICLHIRIVHPYVVSLYAAWKDSKYVYLALEWAPCGNLFDYLVTRGGRLSEEDAAATVMRPLLSALAFLHSQQFIHRDVKLENIIMDASLNIKLADFGLAIDQKFEQANTRLGTFGYFAPEVLDCPLKKGPFDFKDQSLKGYDSKVDVWSAGVVAYELLTGKAPFSAASAARIIEAIRSRMLEYPPELSEEARDFLSQALVRDPEARATAKQLLAHPWIAKFVRRPPSYTGMADGQQQQQAAAGPSERRAGTAGAAQQGQQGQQQQQGAGHAT